ncbi:MAG TPA: ATP-binding protein [Gemmataceae bacterium]|jgi:signal transduction histidine kinase|nr:ATP-binding protein [Gemmataceae bacterium]
MSAALVETILLLEDDPGVARLQRLRLERAGYAVVATATPTDGMECLRQGGIDLLVLDNRLAGSEDGLSFYVRLKANGLDLPTILVTGYSDDATVISALRAGVRDYVFKSVEYLDYLPEAVRRILDQERTKRALAETAREREQALRDLQDKTDELRSTTQQLWQAARLAGIGELAASIAHELNNPLATVSLRLEGVLARTPTDDPRRRPLEIVEQEVERMAKLVGNLLNFSRAGREQVSTVHVSDEVRKTIELTEPHLRRLRVEVAHESAPDVPSIIADRQQLRQVLLNLITNAGDAMPKGGRLTLRVRRGELPGPRPAIVIEVTDTGVGIPTEHLARVTDPFFTTKEEGKGTGLGLAICKRIVVEHRGTFEIDSVVNQGTTVRITLPVTNETNVNGLRGRSRE